MKNFNRQDLIDLNIEIQRQAVRLNCLEKYKDQNNLDWDDIYNWCSKDGSVVFDKGIKYLEKQEPQIYKIYKKIQQEL